MKTFRLLSTMLACLFVALAANAQLTVTSGNVTYDYTLTVPDQATQPVSGRATITFELPKKQFVQFEFKGTIVGKCTANKKKFDVVADEQGRLMLPKKATVKGRNIVQFNFTCAPGIVKRSGDVVQMNLTPEQVTQAFPVLYQSGADARFVFDLEVPDGWLNLSPELDSKAKLSDISFMAGKFQEYKANVNGRDLKVLYGQLDALKQGQLNDLLSQVATAIAWVEQYTGVAFPFTSYTMMLTPGSQKLNVSMPGMQVVSEQGLFLRPNATKDEQAKRQEIVTHELTHVWLDNLIGAKEPQDVLMKEALANFITSKLMLQLGQDKTPAQMKFLNKHQIRAMHADRTGRTHAISEELQSLESDGLRCGNIVSDRATVMMHKLVEMLGEAKFRSSLQGFLMGNQDKTATWRQFATKLNNENPALHIDTAFEAWTRQYGLPTIETSWQNGYLVIRQRAPRGTNHLWNQQVDFRLVYDMGGSKTINVNLNGPETKVKLANRPDAIIPNYSGKGFGYFKLMSDQVTKLTERPIITRNALNRYVLLQTLYDNYLAGNASPYYYGELLRTLEAEKDPVLVETIVKHMGRVLRDKSKAERVRLETALWGTMKNSSNRDMHKQVIKMMADNVTCADIEKEIYNTWRNQTDYSLNERDYTTLAYYIAILRPTEWQTVISTQRQRIKDNNLRQEFDFVSQACNSDVTAQRQFFEKLLKPENQVQENWAIEAMRVLNCASREPQNNYMITPGLDAIEGIQAAHGITFAGEWLNALLGSRRHAEARRTLSSYMASHTAMPGPLKNKILEEGYELMLE